MKSKQVTYTDEHVLFLWKHFREWSIREFCRSCGIKAVTEQLDYCCIEIRNSYGSIIACGLSKQNELWFSAVDRDYRGDNLQSLLINERVKFIQKSKYSTVIANVRCTNISSVINLYKAGFKVTDSIRYQDDEEGFIMSKSLSK